MDKNLTYRQRLEKGILAAKAAGNQDDVDMFEKELRKVKDKQWEDAKTQYIPEFLEHSLKAKKQAEANKDYDALDQINHLIDNQLYYKQKFDDKNESWGDYFKGLGSAVASGSTLGLSNLNNGLRQTRSDFERRHPLVSAAGEIGGMLLPEIATLGGASPAIVAKLGYTGGKGLSKLVDGGITTVKDLFNVFGSKTAAKMAAEKAAEATATPGLAARIGRSALEGAVGSDLYAVGNSLNNPKNHHLGDDLWTGIKYGSVLGGGIPVVSAAAGRVISPLWSQIGKNAKNLEYLKSENIPLTAGDEAGSNFIRKIEGNSPFNEYLRNLKGDQQLAFNRAALKKAGIDGDLADVQTLQKAGQDIGQEFERLGGRNKLLPDDIGRQDIAAAVEDYQNIFDGPAPKFFGTAAKMLEKQEVPGSDYQKLRSYFSQKYNRTKNTSPILADGFRDARNALDANFERSLEVSNPADLGKFDDLRNRYGNFKAIQNSVSGSDLSSTDGNILPRKLLNATRRSVGTGGYTTGEGDFNQLGRDAAKYLDLGETSGKLPFGGTASVGALGGSIYGLGRSPDFSSFLNHVLAGGLAGLVPLGAGTKIGQTYLKNTKFTPSVRQKIDDGLKSLMLFGAGQLN